MESGIKVFPGHSGSELRKMRKTVVEFPFSEVSPSVGGSTHNAFRKCQSILEDLTPHQCDVVLMNLCSIFGKVELG
jgi:hypothetical protein